MSNTEKELKACPFCGPPIMGNTLDPDTSDGKVHCLSCGASAPIAAWNQRPASPLADENKRLRDLVDKYGQHQATCPCWESARLGRNYCNCGYDEALADTVAQAEPIGEREDGCKACAQGVKGPYSQSTGAFHTCKPKGEREGE